MPFTALFRNSNNNNNNSNNNQQAPARARSGVSNYPGQRATLNRRHAPLTYRNSSSNTNTTRNITPLSPTSSGNQTTGAFSVDRSRFNSSSSSAGGFQQQQNHVTYRVTVPPGMRPGQEFQVQAGPQLVRVTCPENTYPGQILQVSLPAPSNSSSSSATSSSFTTSGGSSLLQQRQQQSLVNNITTTGNNMPTAMSGTNHTANSINSQISLPPMPPPGSSALSSSVGNTSTNDNPDGHPMTVMIPQGVRPGDQFQVNLNGQLINVTCPMNAYPGMRIRLNQESLSNISTMQTSPHPPAPPTNQYEVIIPPGISPGQQFQTTLNGRLVNITCPVNAYSGSRIQVNLPPEQQPSNSSTDPAEENTMQEFELHLPMGVRPGEPFLITAGGQRVYVTAPRNCLPGQRLRFKLPLRRGVDITAMKLNYGETAGWMRTLNLDDKSSPKFKWVKLNDNVSSEKSYVSEVQFVPPANNKKQWTGSIILKPAIEATTKANIKLNGKEVVSSGELCKVQARKFQEKSDWLYNICRFKLRDEQTSHIRLRIRRAFLLEDSMNALMSLEREHLRQNFQFEFLGEAGLDAGGLAKEWFRLVTTQMFDPKFGMWSYSSVNQMCLMVNPMSASIFPDEYKRYFRFVGRVLGKAVFDRQLVNGHLVRHLYKHILGFPLSVNDLELLLDSTTFKSINSLKELKESGGDVSDLCLDFTVIEEVVGMKVEKELVPGGGDIMVTNDNLNLYLEEYTKYHLLERTKDQITELLLGFYDVMDEGALLIFDFQELELLLCGVSKIDMSDWRENTLYSGLLARGKNQVVEWFWSVVENDFDDTLRSRLLQFVTGSAGVPAGGFSVLQGPTNSDGNGIIQKFTIHGVAVKDCLYPRAHTCFNRIDLPLYSSRAELSDKLKVAVQLESGFDLE